MIEKREIESSELLKRFNPRSLYEDAITRFKNRPDYDRDRGYYLPINDLLSKKAKEVEERFIEKFSEPGKIEEVRERIKEKMRGIIEKAEKTKPLTLDNKNLELSEEDISILKEVLKVEFPHEKLGPGGTIRTPADIHTNFFYKTPDSDVRYLENVVIETPYREEPRVRTHFDVVSERPHCLNSFAY